MKISFNSIVPRWRGDYSLSFVVLKSYLLSRKIGLDIISNSFYCEDSEKLIISRILSQDANIILFSAYIWNIEIIKKISKDIKENKKHCYIIVGGPEVSYTSAVMLRQNPWLDLLVSGEGEEVLYNILKRINKGIFDFKDIQGITYKQGKEVIDNLPAYTFRVEDQDYEIFLDDFKNSKYFFYETSRGCIFKCRYCAWEKRPKREIRYYNLNKIKSDLNKLFNMPKVKCIAFTDSNILLNKRRGLEIFRFLNELNKERSKKLLRPVSFHFETSPEYFDDEIIEEVIKFPNDNRDESTFSFGLQTINKDVLEKIDRRINLKKFTSNYNKMIDRGLKNVYVEVIHGLPGDNLCGYKKTIDYLISKLDVEYLYSYRCLILPGSYFWEHTEEFGIVWENKPPYKLLYSNTFSKNDLKEAEKLIYYLHITYYCLRRIKKMVDMNFKENKLSIYEKIINHINQNYKDYLYPKTNEEDVVNDIRNLQKAENSNIRQKIIQEVRNIINTYQNKS